MCNIAFEKSGAAELGVFGFGACESKIFKYSFLPCQHHNPYHQSWWLFCGVEDNSQCSYKLVQQEPQMIIPLVKGVLQ